MKTLIFLGALTLLAACGSGAVVTTKNGASYSGEIMGHDVEGRISIAGTTVDRDDVTDIDHPGNVAGILGSIVAGVGAASALANCTSETRAESGDTPCASSGLWILTGIPIAIYGWITHGASVERAGMTSP